MSTILPFFVLCILAILTLLQILSLFHFLLQNPRTPEGLQKGLRRGSEGVSEGVSEGCLKGFARVLEGG